MGGAASTASKHKDLGKSQHDIVKLMMPLYYDPTEVTSEEHKIAVNSWQLILTDKSPEYLARQQDEGFKYHSCVTFFYDNYYVRLFDIHPMSKELFKSGMKGQGRFLVMMISLALSEIEKPAQFDKTLLKLAANHYRYGVKAVEYGIVGDVLFWALRKALGDNFYTAQVHLIWVKIYSRMLKTIVPEAVSFELHANPEDSNTKRDMTGMFGVNATSNTSSLKPDETVADELECQKAINNNKIVQLRPPMNV